MFEKYIGQNHIKDLLSKFVEYSKSSTTPLQHMLITGGSGLGKALPLDTLILTNNGFIKNKDIKVGDYVIDPFGKQVKVLGVYPQGLRQCYKLTFIDGRTIEADENHLWEIFNRQYDDTPMVFTTAFLYKMMQGRNKMFYKQCRVRLFNGRYGIKKDFIIHPYLLGVLLGDGILSRGCSWCKPDIEIVEKIKLLIHNDYKINKHDYENKCPIFIVVRKDGKHSDNIYINELRRLNLMNTNSVNKFIPEEYFHCSYEQRLELLRGLLDTDGHITKDGSLEYSTSSVVLAKQVQSLVWSLGYRCSVVKRKTRCNGKWFESYRLHIVGEDRNNLFSLKRKKSEHQAQVQIKDLLITKIEKVDKKETQCIYVDSNEHLYIAENYITTHNTTLATTISKELGVKCVSLLATNASEDDLIKAICNLSDKDILFIDECLSGDTEVLTENGYIRLDKLTTETRVAQWNNGVIEFVYPERIVKKYTKKVYELPIKDNMILYQTEHHRNLIYDKQSKTNKVKYPSQLTSAHSIICSGKIKDKHNKLTLLEKLIIMTQADGSVNDKNVAGIPVTFSISLSKQRKIKYLNSLIKLDINNSFKIREVKGAKAHDNVKSMKRWLYNLPKTSKDYKLLANWFTLTDFDLSKANEFLKNIFIWDSADYATGKVYCTTEKANAEFVYQVMVLAGYTPYISKQIDKRGYKTHYRVYMPDKTRKLSLQHIHEKRKLIDWNDYMYCITVPSTFFIVKKDGYTFVTGNCHALNKKLIEILFPIISEHILYTKYQGVMTRFRVSNFTIIGATTHEGKLPTALLNRFTVTLNLKPYTESELTAMTKLYLGQYKADDTMLNAIVNMSKGVPRIITNITNSVKIYLKSLGKDTLEQKDLKMIQMFLGVNEIGLNNVDFEILRYLSKVKSASLKTLANVLSIEAINIEQVHEPYLIKLGFIERSSAGRTITDAGRKYLVDK